MVILEPVLLQTVSKCWCFVLFCLVCLVIIHTAFRILWLNWNLWSSKVWMSPLSPLFFSLHMGALSDTAQLCFLYSDNDLIHKDVAPGTADVLLLFIKDAEWELVLTGVLQQSFFWNTWIDFSASVCMCHCINEYSTVWCCRGNSCRVAESFLARLSSWIWIKLVWIWDFLHFHLNKWHLNKWHLCSAMLSSFTAVLYSCVNCNFVIQMRMRSTPACDQDQVWERSAYYFLWPCKAEDILNCHSLN